MRGEGGREDNRCRLLGCRCKAWYVDISYFIIKNSTRLKLICMVFEYDEQFLFRMYEMFTFLFGCIDISSGSHPSDARRAAGTAAVY